MNTTFKVCNVATKNLTQMLESIQNCTPINLVNTLKKMNTSTFKV